MTDFLAATRASYDTVAASYAEQVPPLEEDPLDRALLRAFADLVHAAGGGPIADVGCGTGRVTTYLDAIGLDVSGIDPSPAMLAIARRNRPDLRYSEGSLPALDLPDAALAGAVAWYSVIHLPADRLPAAFAELHRVLAPGGYLQLAFHAGDRRHHRTSAYGHDGLALDVYWLPVAGVRELLAAAGFTVAAETVRTQPPLPTPQARLLARRDG